MTSSFDMFWIVVFAVVSTNLAAIDGQRSLKGHVISKRDAVTRLRLLWPAVIDYDYKVVKVVIPYTVKKGVWWWSDDLDRSDEIKIQDAMSVIEEHTCLRFVERKIQRDYIEFFKDTNNFCESDIGRRGGRQRIALGDGCRNPGHVTHEIMHSLGFYHEHTRPDRNKYIRILWDNIKPGNEGQFKVRSLNELTTLGQPYDFRSIMHYHRKEFSKNGDNTIESLQDPDMILGSLSSLSAVDVMQLNRLYRCPQAAKQVDNYHVTVATGDGVFAGTDAKVFIELYGSHGDLNVNSGEIQLLSKQGHFESGSEDNFNIIAPDLGFLNKLTVRHNSEGLGPSWFLKEIKVVDDARRITYHFSCSCWLSGYHNTQTLSPSRDHS